MTIKSVPKKWAEDELNLDIGASTLDFAKKRIAESPEIYSEFYKQSCETFAELVFMLPDLYNETSPYPLLKKTTMGH